MAPSRPVSKAKAKPKADVPTPAEDPTTSDIVRPVAKSSSVAHGNASDGNVDAQSHAPACPTGVGIVEAEQDEAVKAKQDEALQTSKGGAPDVSEWFGRGVLNMLGEDDKHGFISPVLSELPAQFANDDLEGIWFYCALGGAPLGGGERPEGREVEFGLRVSDAKGLEAINVVVLDVSAEMDDVIDGGGNEALDGSAPVQQHADAPSARAEELLRPLSGLPDGRRKDRKGTSVENGHASNEHGDDAPGSWHDSSDNEAPGSWHDDEEELDQVPLEPESKPLEAEGAQRALDDLLHWLDDDDEPPDRNDKTGKSAAAKGDQNHRSGGGGATHRRSRSRCRDRSASSSLSGFMRKAETKERTAQCQPEKSRRRRRSPSSSSSGSSSRSSSTFENSRHGQRGGKKKSSRKTKHSHNAPPPMPFGMPFYPGMPMWPPGMMPGWPGAPPPPPPPAPRQDRAYKKQQKEQKKAEAKMSNAIDAVRKALPEELVGAHRELEHVMAENTMRKGPRSDQLRAEAKKVATQAQDGVEAISQLEERGKKAELEVVAMEIDVDEVVTAANNFIDNVEQQPLEGLSAACNKLASKLDDITSRLSVLSNSLAEKVKATIAFDASLAFMRISVQRLKTVLHGLFKQIIQSCSTLEGLRQSIFHAARKVVRTVAAGRRDVAYREQFSKYDVDGDDMLSGTEVRAMATGEYGFAISDAALDKILGVLDRCSDGVAFQDYHRLRVKVAIAKSEADARLQQADRDATIAVLVPAAQAALTNASTKVSAAVVYIQKQHVKSKSSDNRPEDSLDSEGEDPIKLAELAVEEMMQKVQDMKDVGLHREATKLRMQATAVKSRLGRIMFAAERAKAMALAKAEREKTLATTKAKAEIEALRTTVVRALSDFAKTEGMTREQLWSDLGGGHGVDEGVSCEVFYGFLASVGLDLEERDTERIVEHIAGGADCITEDGFYTLFPPRVAPRKLP